MAVRLYKVLLVEDDPLVLERLRDRLSTVEYEAGGDHWQLALRPVRICVEHTNDRFFFSQQTLNDIALAVHDGIDLAVVDYGYVHPEAVAAVNAAAIAAGRAKPIKEDVQGRILTTEDLAVALRDYVSDTSADAALRRAVQERLFTRDNQLPVVLYSYPSPLLYDALQSVEARKNRTAAAFATFQVTAVDTRLELYNRDEFDSWSNGPTKHDLDYYSFLVSGLLVMLVRQRFLEHLLRIARSLKYIRVKKSLRSVTLLVAMGAAIAGVGQWLSEQYTSLMRSGAYGLASVVAVVAILVVVAIGTLLPLIFEWLMVILLRPDASE